MYCRMLSCQMLSVAAVLLSVCCWQASAQEAQTQEAAKDTAKPDIATLIKQLDADEYNERQTASRKLADAGESALPALEKAAASDSREMSMRAFDILKGHFDKGTPAVKDAARQSLERISKGDLGAASRRAAEALTPPMANTPNNPNGNVRGLPFAPAAGGIRIAGGARVVVAAGAVGGGVETKIKVENGVKTTEVKDKDRQVKIVDDPDKGLQLEVTETKDGKETTQKYEAKNADELKTKHAEAHKIYEQYSQKGAEIKIGGFGFAPAAAPLPIAPVPVPAIAPARLVPAFPALPPMAVPGEIAPAPKKADALEGLDKAIQEAEASLKEALKQSGDSEQLKRATLRLEEVRKQLEQLRSSLK